MKTMLSKYAVDSLGRQCTHVRQRGFGANDPLMDSVSLDWFAHCAVWTVSLLSTHHIWSTLCTASMYTVSIAKAMFLANLGPVVQSVVSLTSSLRVISLTVLADSIYNILIFFLLKKMWVAFALQKLLTFFQQKISAYLRISWCKF